MVGYYSNIKETIIDLNLDLCQAFKHMDTQKHKKGFSLIAGKLVIRKTLSTFKN